VIGEQDVPVYYYQDAATRPERELLPDVRRVSTKAWRAVSGPGGCARRRPGGLQCPVRRLHRGVRFPLIAFNVNLATNDVA